MYKPISKIYTSTRRKRNYAMPTCSKQTAKHASYIAFGAMMFLLKAICWLFEKSVCNRNGCKRFAFSRLQRQGTKLTTFFRLKYPT